MSATNLVSQKDTKHLRGSESNYEISSKFSSSIITRGPYISSYRLFRCPSVSCNKTLSPSTLLQHFLVDHRELEPSDLHPGSGVVSDVAAELKDFKEMDPKCIRLIEIKGTRMKETPLLVNAYCLVDKHYSNDNSKTRSNHGASGQWVCLWLSSVCNFDNWFSIRLFNKGSPQTSMIKICKPLLVQHPMTTVEIVEDLNVMIIQHSTIDSICHNQEKLNLEVKMYET